jgi:hypothetical protein
MVLSMPLTPTQLIEQGPKMRRLLAMPRQSRTSWLEKYTKTS